MGYEEEKQKALNIISKGDTVIVDTNIVVGAATRGDSEFLGKLIAYKKFFLTTVNVNEIYGLSANKDFEEETKQILKNFLKDMRGRVIRVSKEEVKRIENILYTFAPLLPRSVASYVLIDFVDGLIGRYEQITKLKSIPDEIYKVLIQKYKQEVAELGEKCEIRYVGLIEELGIAEFNEKPYFRDIRVIIATGLKEIDEAVIRSGGKIEVIISELEKFKKKTHDSDIRHVAQKISAGATKVSEDSDVKWLFTFYALRS